MSGMEFNSFQVYITRMSHVLGTEQLSESSTSSKQSEEQPGNLGHCDMGTVHNTVHHGHHSARLPSTHQ